MKSWTLLLLVGVLLQSVFIAAHVFRPETSANNYDNSPTSVPGAPSAFASASHIPTTYINLVLNTPTNPEPTETHPAIFTTTISASAPLQDTGPSTPDNAYSATIDTKPTPIHSPSTTPFPSINPEDGNSFSKRSSTPSNDAEEPIIDLDSLWRIAAGLRCQPHVQRVGGFNIGPVGGHAVDCSLNHLQVKRESAFQSPSVEALVAVLIGEIRKARRTTANGKSTIKVYRRKTLELDIVKDDVEATRQTQLVEWEHIERTKIETSIIQARSAEKEAALDLEWSIMDEMKVKTRKVLESADSFRAASRREYLRAASVAFSERYTFDSSSTQSTATAIYTPPSHSQLSATQSPISRTSFETLSGTSTREFVYSPSTSLRLSFAKLWIAAVLRIRPFAIWVDESVEEIYPILDELTTLLMQYVVQPVRKCRMPTLYWRLLAAWMKNALRTFYLGMRLLVLMSSMIQYWLFEEIQRRGSVNLPGTYAFGNAGSDDENDDLEHANEQRGRQRPDYILRTADTRTIQRALLRNGRYYQRSRSWSPLQYIPLPSHAQLRIFAQEPLVTPFVPATRVAVVNSDARSAPSQTSLRSAPPRNVGDQGCRSDATRTPPVAKIAVKKSNKTRQGQIVTKGPAVTVASCSVSSVVKPSRPAATAVKPVLVVCPKCSVKSESQSTVGTSNPTNAIDTIKKPTSTKPVIESQTATQHQASNDVAVKPVAASCPAALASDVYKAVAPAQVTAERAELSPRAAHQSPVANAQNKASVAVVRTPMREITNETRTPLNTRREAEAMTAANRVKASDEECPRAPATPATGRVVRFEEPVVQYTVERACEKQAAPPAIAPHAEADVVGLCQARPVEAQERKVQSLPKKPRARPVARSSANVPKSTSRQVARTRTTVTAAANSVTRVSTGRHVSNRCRKAKEHLGPDRPLRAERPAPYVRPTVKQMPVGVRGSMSSSVNMGTQATPAGNTTRWPVPVTPTPATRVPQHGNLKAYSPEVRKSLVKVMAIAKEPLKISLACRIGVRLSTGAIPLVMRKIERVNVFGSHRPAYFNTAHVWIPSGGLGGASTAVTSQVERMEAVMEIDYRKRTVDQLEISAEEAEACGGTGSMGMVENGLFASNSPRSTMTVGIDAERLEDAGMEVDDNDGLPSFDFSDIKLSDSDEQVKRKRYEELWACRG